MEISLPGYDVSIRPTQLERNDILGPAFHVIDRNSVAELCSLRVANDMPCPPSAFE